MHGVSETLAAACGELTSLRKSSVCGLAVVVMFLISASLLRATTPGALDPSFPAGVASAGFNGAVFAVALAAGDKVYVGGSFTSVHGVVRQRIARLNANGTVDTSFDPGAGPDNDVNTIAVQADGKVLIGGGFTSYNGTSRVGIARLNADGTLDTSFNPGTGAVGGVTSMALQSDGKVLIGGFFSTFNGTARSCIARLNANGSLDTSFNPGTGVVGSGFQYLRSVALQSDGKVLIGGFFTTYNGTARNRIARLNANGSLDTAFNPGTGADNDVYSIAIQSDGKAVIGGGFTTFNGTARSGIARLNTNGSLDTTFNPGTEVAAGDPTYVASVAVHTDGTVFIGGNFTSFNGSGSIRIARLNSNGTLNAGFFVGAGADDRVAALAVRSDGKAVIGGFFSSVGGTDRSRIARLNANGSLDFVFNSGSGPNDFVATLAVQGDDKVLIVGGFTAYSGVECGRIARLNADGTLDTTFNSGTGANGYVSSIVVQSDGKVIIGGDFTSYNGIARSRLARLNADGSLDTSFVPIVTSGPNSLAVQPDGKVLVGATFTGSQPGVIRLNANGSLDTGFNLAIGLQPGQYLAAGEVYSIVVQNDGKVLLGGAIENLWGPVAFPRGVARLNANGSLDTSFSTGISAYTPFYCVALQPDGKILAAGWSSSSGAILERRHPNGSIDTSFQAASFPNSSSVPAIRTIAIQSDGKVLIGGSFLTWASDGTSFRWGVARLQANGSLDPSFNASSSSSGLSVYALAMQGDGRVLIGGDFTDRLATGGRRFLARLFNNPASRSLTTPSSSRLEWLRGGSAPEVDQVTFENSSNGGAWTLLGNGTRISGGWELTGQNLSGVGQVRARGRAVGATYQGGFSIIEQVAAYDLGSGGGGFANWPLLASLPADRRGPMDRNGPLQLQNMLAYATGLNPLTATAADLPRVAAVAPGLGSFRFQYRRSTTTSGVTLRSRLSTSLQGWVAPQILSTQVIHDSGQGWQIAEETIQLPPGGKAFLRLEAIQP